jgi:hypothetical protein
VNYNFVCCSNSSLFYVLKDDCVFVFHVSPHFPFGLDLLKESETKRSLTKVEEDELHKKEQHIQKYEQKKGLMLNLSENTYTESSKPMGLDFAMEGPFLGRQNISNCVLNFFPPTNQVR